MKTLLASTAIAFALTGAAVAQTMSPMVGAFVSQIDTQALRASDLLGARLYVSEAEIDITGGLSPDWDDVGEISDVILGDSGEVDAVLLDIGGFLGIGERTVAVNMDTLQFVSDGAAADDYFVVIQGVRADLEAAPEFNQTFTRGRTPMAMDGAAMPMTDGQAATTQAVVPVVVAPAAGTGMATDAGAAVPGMAPRTDMGMMPPMIERDGYTTLDRAALTADDIENASVYGINDERIGEVGSLVLGQDGKLQDAIIDVGGFLGLGEKPVAVPFDSLTILRGNTDVRIYVDGTKEQFESLPAYEG